MTDRSTIFALSSGQLPSGVAIIRVSGPNAATALDVLGGRTGTPRVATYAVLHDMAGQPIDQALTLWFPGPASATGEDVAEFQVHGSRAVVAALAAALAALPGLRLAEPGEFSRRAFENGKLDLVAAEALDDLIHADTEQQRRLALRQLNGLLGDHARDWRQRIIEASALIEAGIDFGDEGDVASDTIATAREATARLRLEIDAVLAGSARSERMRDGLVVVIAGPPNVGKSTLMNLLARREVAIVSPNAGTTRDVIEVHLDLKGYPVTVVDTAGLREAPDPVEQEGIRRAAVQAAAADLVLWLTDAADRPVAEASGRAEVWVIATKADLGPGGAAADHHVSSKTGSGVDRLVEALVAFAGSRLQDHSAIITRARHRTLLTGTSEYLAAALDQRDAELIAEELRGASDVLGQLLGRVDVEDVLDAIFSRFCIGK